MVLPGRRTRGRSGARLRSLTGEPVANLDRILDAPSDPGDLVLDPFCGGGTTMHAAGKRGRSWVEIDRAHLAIGLIEKRLRGALEGVQVTPMACRRALKARAPSPRGARIPSSRNGRCRRSARSRGTCRSRGPTVSDGNLWFGAKNGGRALVSVNAGDSVAAAMLRDLPGTVEREGPGIGVLVTRNEPTRPMLTEAAGAGRHGPPGFAPVLRFRIVTVEEAMRLRDRAVRLPARRDDAFRKAPRETTPGGAGRARPLRPPRALTGRGSCAACASARDA